MPEERILINLKNKNNLSIIRATSTIELEKNYLPVRIPLLKGILGYRIFLIHSKNQDKFATIRSIDELKKMTVGQGRGRSDVELLIKNGFNVVVGDEYETLFKILIAGRFDYFSRGINEAFDEYLHRKNLYPDLLVEKTICIQYPFAEYFFFNKDDLRLASRVEAGLKIMIKDGSFDQIFDKYYKDIIIKADLSKRKIFKINNPLLPSETPLYIKEYWINPAFY